MIGEVLCPRCDRTTDAAGVWLWIGGQAERLTVENGWIQQSGHVDVFDLGCGCKFDTELWMLAVQTSVSARSGESVTVRVASVPGFPKALIRDVAAREAAVEEAMGTLIAKIINRILGDLDLTEAQREKAAQVIPFHLRSVRGG